MQILKGHGSGKVVTALAFSPDGTQLASAARDWTARLWELSSGKGSVLVDVCLGRNEGDPYSVAFSPDGAHLAVGCFNRVKVRDSAGRWVKELKLPSHDPLWLRAQYAPDGRVLAAVGLKIWSWDTATWKLRPDWSKGDEATACLAFTPDGRALATGHTVSRIKLWDVDTGQERAELRNEAGLDTTALAFAPDGRTLAASCGPYLVIWDTIDRRQREPIYSERLHYRGVAFAPDGRFLLVAHNDKTIRLVGAASGEERQAFDWGLGAMASVAFAPDGMRAAAGSAKGKIVVWDIDF
jgi:WD40 repeat protein